MAMPRPLEGIVSTIDFHVTSECSQECPYCWGPQDFENPVDTGTAFEIISRIRELGARRIVFTGGDPVKRPDIDQLIRHARTTGLEVAVSTTGDELREDLLGRISDAVDLISLPLDGSTEEINAKTKKEGHFAAIMRALDWLRKHPAIDVKVCTPVTRHNLADVPNIARLVEHYAQSTKARVFYNVFQAFPRAMHEVEWDGLLVSDQEFEGLRRQTSGVTRITVNFLDHKTLDKLYMIIFPDGSLIVPRGKEFMNFGPILDVDNFAAIVAASSFDSAKHIRHSKGWGKSKGR